MNIAIYDLQHYELVNTLLHILEDHNISLITCENLKTKVLASEIKNTNVKFITLEEHESFHVFLYEALEKCSTNNIDLYIFSTIDSNYKEIYQFIKKINKPIFITIHNVNTWLKPPFTLNIKALNYYYYRFKIKQKTNSYFVLDNSIKEYIEQNKLTKKKVHIIPYSINIKKNEISTENKINDELVICIPGGIDGHRRDIITVIEAIQKINNPKIYFKFIGAPLGEIGEKIVEKINLLNSMGYSLSHFYNPNNNVLFENIMKQSDIILCPLIVETKFEGIKEIYGLTKATGITFDLLRFEKPGIFPQNFNIPKNLNNCILKYDSLDNLVNLIKDLNNNRDKLNALKKNIENESKKNSKEVLKKSINEILSNTVNKW
jgi:glycosyltransferase involved in cell wall biosynthesis